MPLALQKIKTRGRERTRTREENPCHAFAKAIKAHVNEDGMWIGCRWYGHGHGDGCVDLALHQISTVILAVSLFSFISNLQCLKSVDLGFVTALDVAVAAPAAPGAVTGVKANGSSWGVLDTLSSYTRTCLPQKARAYKVVMTPRHCHRHSQI